MPNMITNTHIDPFYPGIHTAIYYMLYSSTSYEYIFCYDVFTFNVIWYIHVHGLHMYFIIKELITLFSGKQNDTSDGLPFQSVV